MCALTTRRRCKCRAGPGPPQYCRRPAVSYTTVLWHVWDTTVPDSKRAGGRVGAAARRVRPPLSAPSPPSPRPPARPLLGEHAGASAAGRPLRGTADRDTTRGGWRGAATLSKRAINEATSRSLDVGGASCVHAIIMLSCTCPLPSSLPWCCSLFFPLIFRVWCEL